MQDIKVVDLQSALEMKAHKFAEGKSLEFRDVFYSKSDMPHPTQGWGGFRNFVKSVKGKERSTSVFRTNFNESGLEKLTADYISESLVLQMGLIYFHHYTAELKRLEDELVGMVDNLQDLMGAVEDLQCQ